MRIRLRLTLLATGLVAATLTSGSASSAEVSTTVVAVGDIARINGGQNATGSLAKTLAPSKVLMIGDLAYTYGSDDDFARLKNSTWKTLLPKTFAVPGNHEYKTLGAAGYRRFINSYSMPRSGDNYWWVKRINNWTVIGLDSEVVSKGSAGAQETFFKDALKANAGRPTIVMWHRPRFTSGLHGNATDTQKLWSIASGDKDVKLVLWGHDHNYERRTRTIGKGTAKEHKVITLLIGTGGAELRSCALPSAPPKLICGTSGNYGVVALNLKSKSFTWKYHQVDGTADGRVKDSGTFSW